MCLQVEKMASIVVKLIMDMWLQADPVESFALMLPMLRAALAQQDPIYRVRAFDLVYNLSLHAQMIEPVGGSSSGGGGQERGSISQPPGRNYRRMQPAIVNVADSARSNRHGDISGSYEVCIAISPSSHSFFAHPKVTSPYSYLFPEPGLCLTTCDNSIPYGCQLN